MADRYGDRYGAPRPRSPNLYNPARASLPINISGYPAQDVHLHAVPSSRREVIPAPRSSTSSVNSGGTVTTTYKIKADVPTRGSSVREGSRTRRASTIDNSTRPHITTTAASNPRHRPIVHSAGISRPESPLRNPYRSSEEEYITIPATSRHGGHHHHKHHSAHLDRGELSHLTNERDEGRLRVTPVREPAYRSRPAYSGTVVRRADNVADDYGDDGYGYTKPGDLAQYDLEHTEPVYRRPRRDSFEGGRRSRPTSIAGYGDLLPRAHETKERGPPPSTRGFDKIRTPTWDQQQVRMPAPSSALEPVHRPSPFDPIEPIRRSNSRARASTYQDREPRRAPREEIYEVKEDPRRLQRRERPDEAVEQRGFGVKTDRPERVDRVERIDWADSRTEAADPRHERTDSRNGRLEPRVERERAEPIYRSERRDPQERPDRSDRVERNERAERNERTSRTESDRPKEKEHKSRDVLATGLSIAGAALGLNAVKNATRDDREDREEREDRGERRRDKDEPRRGRDDRDIVDLSGRDPKEKRSRDNDVPARNPPRETPSPRGVDMDRLPVDSSLGERDREEHHASRAERDSIDDPERRERRRLRRPDIPEPRSSESSISEESTPHPRRERHLRDSVAGPGVAAFNPKDAMDLKALKEALNSKDKESQSSNDPAPMANAGEARSRTPRESMTRDRAEAADIRNELKEDRRSREPLAPAENKQLRVVSPPRDKPEEKRVKGILRQPKEKFPEDPTPIREGVAPLKDAKKDGIPPDARWTKISRRLVNPAALEAGKERFEAREEFVIVLRVLSKEEVQGYAEVTQRIRAQREELDEVEAAERRAKRRARHERHKHERKSENPRSERRQHHRRGSQSDSESDTSETEDEYDKGGDDKPLMLESAPPKKKATFEEAVMSGGLGETQSVPSGAGAVNLGNLRETAPGQYSGYVRNPPAASSAGGRSAAR